MHHSNLFSRTCLLAAALFAAASCMNEDYDLTKEIDTVVGVDGDFSLPLGSSDTLKVGEILDLETDDVLRTDADGDYYVLFSGSSFNTTVTVPEITLVGALVSGGGVSASFSKDRVLAFFGISPAAASRIPIPEGSDFSATADATSVEVFVDQAIDESVAGIRKVEADAQAIVSLRSYAGNISLSGLSVDFPDYFVFAAPASSSQYSFSESGNVLTLADTDITSRGLSITLNITGIDFSLMPEGQGFLADSHRIFLDDEVKVSSFGVAASLNDFGTYFSSVPETLGIDLSIDIPAVEINSMELKLDPDVDVEDQMVQVGGLPEFLNGDNLVLDLYNPSISLSVNNSSPLAFAFNADVISYSPAGETTVHLGDDGSASATDEILVKPEGLTEMYLSRTGDGAPAGAENIVVERLSQLISTVPDSISVCGIDVKAADEYITLYNVETTYSFRAEYEISAPLAFGTGLNIVYTTDVTGWNDDLYSDNEDLSIDLSSLEVGFTCLNTIPLKLAITAAAIDSLANVISGISVDLDSDVEPGSISSPSEKEYNITISGDEASFKRLDGLRLQFTASQPDPDYAGVCLNESQGLLFKDVHARLIGNVQTDIEKL